MSQKLIETTERLGEDVVLEGVKKLKNENASKQNIILHLQGGIDIIYDTVSCV